MEHVVAILFLIFMEGLLSFDNALALAVMCRHLPPEQQRRALTYGMAGAFFFRALALVFLTYLMQNVWVKILGGSYLLWLTTAFFLRSDEEKPTAAQATTADFWRTVVLVELTDIAFSVDSILAAVAVSSEWWVVFTGGILGIIMMRFAAGAFISLLNRFPKLEQTAYLLVGLVGAKLILEGWWKVDFHSGTPFWIFWGCMAISITLGFATSQGRENGQDTGNAQEHSS